MSWRTCTVLHLKARIRTIIQLNNNSFESTVQLTKAPVDSNFNYQWQDDSSYVGHAQQAYINDKVEIVVLGKAEKVPDDFNGIQLLYTYGFLLNDSLTKWTTEEAYRLYQNISKFNFRKFGEKDSGVKEILGFDMTLLPNCEF